MVKLGDIFLIPLPNSCFGVGYVIARKRPVFYMGALDIQIDPNDRIDVSWLSRADRFACFGNFFDSKLKNGDWSIVGNVTPDLSRYPFPNFKIKKGDDYFVESWDGAELRKATPEDIMKYDNPTNRAPMILQNGLSSILGLRAADPKYNKITANYVVQQSS